MRNNLTKIALAAILGLALAFIFSCSSDDGGGDTGGVTYTYGIENVTDSSFTMVEKWNKCQEDGTLKEETDKETVNYSVNGKILSFYGYEFNGNPTSPNRPYGIWTREPYSVACREDDKDCWYNGFSKAVFEQNTLILTKCYGKAGEESTYENYYGIVQKRKVIDCSTIEWTHTKGTETVMVIMDSEKQIATFNNKICTSWLSSSEYIISQERAVCTEAFNRAKAEGYDGSGWLVNRYFHDILYQYEDKCLEDNSFPEWFGFT